MGAEIELAVEPRPGAVFHQRGNVDSDAATVQRVILFPDNACNMGPWGFRIADRQPLNDARYDGFFCIVTHLPSVRLTVQSVKKIPAG